MVWLWILSKQFANIHLSRHILCDKLLLCCVKLQAKKEQREQLIDISPTSVDFVSIFQCANGEHVCFPCRSSKNTVHYDHRSFFVSVQCYLQCYLAFKIDRIPTRYPIIISLSFFSEFKYLLVIVLLRFGCEIESFYIDDYKFLCNATIMLLVGKIIDRL